MSLSGIQATNRATLLTPDRAVGADEDSDDKEKRSPHSGERKNVKAKNRPVEFLTSYAERFRMRLIRDFRLLENVNEMEQGLEAPKYHPNDIENEHCRNRILSENPYALVKFSPISKLTGIVSKQERRWKRIKCRETAYPPLDMWANWVVESNPFQNFMLVLILVNAVLLVVDAEIGESTDPQLINVVRIIRTCDYCCLWIFVIEIVLKWIDDFKTFWKNVWNELDFYITIVSILPEVIRWFNGDAISSSLMSSLSFLRVLRITRLLKMVSRFEQARIILMSVSKAFSAMSFILLLLALFMWMFALMGEVIFGRYTQYDGRTEGIRLIYQKAFSGILWSFATLFQLMTLDHWLETLTDLLIVMKSSYESTITVIYILAWIWVGSFVFKNIFAGIMVNNFQTIRNDMHWEKREKEAKNEVDKFKKEYSSERAKSETDPALTVDNAPSQRKASDTLPIIKVESTSNTTERRVNSNENLDLASKNFALLNGISQSKSALSVFSQLSLASAQLSEQENPTTSQGTLRQAHWDSLVQRHMDLTSASTGETIWARDVLFKFYQAMENIQENLKERQDILNLLNLALLQIHDR